MMCLMKRRFQLLSKLRTCKIDSVYVIKDFEPEPQCSTEAAETNDLHSIISFLMSLQRVSDTFILHTKVHLSLNRLITPCINQCHEYLLAIRASLTWREVISWHGSSGLHSLSSGPLVSQTFNDQLVPL